MDIESTLFDEHDPGPKPIVDEVPLPAANEGAPAVPTIAADAPLDQGVVIAPSEGGAPGAAADKGKQPATSEQTEVAS